MAPNKRGVSNKEVYDYRSKEGQNSLMSRPELPGRMEASIRLSQWANNIFNAIRGSIKQECPDFVCNRHGDIIVVSGYPPRNNFVAGEILVIVQRHDHHAVMQN